VSDSKHLIVEREGHVLVLTMNRPEARNAFGLEMLALMADAWQLADDDDDVRAIVLTGAGGNFCAGSDLKLMHQKQEGGLADRFKADPQLHWKALLRNMRPKKPVIAAVEGYALAGGTEILQGTDIRVAAKSATFGVTEVRRGLFPLGGSTVRLRRQIPHAVATDMLLSGRRLSADEALQFGLVSRVVEDGKALEVAKTIGREIAEDCGPLAVQAVKRSIYETSALSEADALALELTIGQPVFMSEDAKEGPRAFMEKRKAVYKGR
jgi:enoyl-CoA hydratase